MAVPSFMVYRLEGHTAGLDGPCSRGSQCAGGDKEGQPRNAFSAIDGHTPGVRRIADISTLRHLKRRAVVQRYRAVVGPPLPGAQEGPSHMVSNSMINACWSMSALWSRHGY